MKETNNATKGLPHGEERLKGASRTTHSVGAATRSDRDRFLHKLLRRGRLLPSGDADFPGRWRAIKIAFAKALAGVEPRSAVVISRGERAIWERRYGEHTIRDDHDFAAHFGYIHCNPVKHGLAGHTADWPYSTFRR